MADTNNESLLLKFVNEDKLIDVVCRPDLVTDEDRRICVECLRELSGKIVHKILATMGLVDGAVFADRHLAQYMIAFTYLEVALRRQMQEELERTKQAERERNERRKDPYYDDLDSSCGE